MLTLKKRFENTPDGVLANTLGIDILKVIPRLGSNSQPILNDEGRPCKYILYGRRADDYLFVMPIGTDHKEPIQITLNGTVSTEFGSSKVWQMIYAMPTMKEALEEYGKSEDEFDLCFLTGSFFGWWPKGRLSFLRLASEDLNQPGLCQPPSIIGTTPEDIVAYMCPDSQADKDALVASALLDIINTSF